MNKFANKGLEKNFIEYYKNHKDISITECSKIIGVSNNTGHYYLKKNNIKTYEQIKKEKQNKILIKCAEYYQKNIGIPIRTCAEKFGLKRWILSDYLKKNNIKKHEKMVAKVNGKRYIISRKGSRGTKKYFLNENFFDIIDTEEKAYWLGFLLADGSVSSTSNRIKIGLSIRDYDHLHRLKKSLSLTCEIKIYMPNIGHEACSIEFSSEQIKNKLISYNIIPNKKYLGKKPFLKLKKELIPHYIRGFFDGDGCISEYKRIENNHMRYSLEIASSVEMLSFIKEYLKDNDIEMSDIKPHMTIYGMKTSNNIEIIKFFNLIYKNANIYLPRKYERLENISRIYSISDGE